MKNIFTLLIAMSLYAGSTWGQNQAITYTGSATSYSQVLNSPALNPTTITVEAWIYPTAWGVSQFSGSIVTKEVVGYSGYMLRCGANGTLSFAIGITTGVPEIFQTAALTLNTWQHVVGVFDGTKLYLYINGNLIKSQAQTGSIASNTNNLRIGGNMGFTDRFFTGKIDEVRIWNTALSAGTINTWYNKTISSCHPNYANLVGYYECDNSTVPATLVATVGATGTVNSATYGAANNASFLGAVTGFQSITATQVLGTVNPNTTNNEVIRIDLQTFSPMDLTQLVLRTDGTTNVADITNAKIWCTGTSNVFAAATQFGSTIATPPAAGTDMVFNGTYTMGCGTYYFWLTYDIPSGATLTNLVDGLLQSAVVDAISRTPVVSDPTGSRNINTCTSPSIFAITGGGGFCAGGVGVAVGLSGSQTGVSYQLYNGVNPVGTAVAGTGSALAFGNQTGAGTYTVQTTTAGGYCATPMTGTAVITVNTTPSVSSSATGSACSGIAQNYTITSGVVGTTFTWSRAAVAGVSNTAVSNQTSNPITEVLNNTIASAVNVNYLIVPSVNGCTGSTFTYTVTVNITPEAPIIGNTIQPTCITTSGSVTLDGLPMVGTWTVTKNPGGTTYTGTGIFTTITGLAPGTYSFTVANAGGCISPSSANVVINSIPSPPPTPVVTQNGFILQSSALGGNQWYNLNGLISGAVYQNYTVTANGSYYVIVTLAGCVSDTSNLVTITNYGIEDNLLQSKIKVYPNPSNDKLYVNFSEINEIPQSIKMFNTLGQIVFETTEPLTADGSGIDVSRLNAGAYTLQIIFDKGMVNKEIIVN